MSAVPPWIPIAGETLTVEDLYAVLLWMTDLFDRKITPDMMYRDANGDIVLQSNLDLRNFQLLGAANIATGIVNLRDFGLTASPSANELQDAIDRAVAEGFRRLYLPPGTYTLSATSLPLRIPARVHLDGAGYSTLITTSANASPHGGTMILAEGEGSIISNLRVQSTAAGFNTGIRLLSTRMSKVENVWCDGLFVGVAFDDSYRCEVETVFVTGCASGVSFSNCQSSGMTHVRFEAGLADGYGIRLSGCQSMTAIANVIEGAHRGVSLDGCVDCTVQADVRGSTLVGITLSGCSVCSVTGSHAIDNSMSATAKEPGIELSSCSGCSVKNSISNVSDADSHQTFGVAVIGGEANQVGASILLPNRGPNGDATGTASYNPAFRIRNESSRLSVYAINPVPIGLLA